MFDLLMIRWRVERAMKPVSRTYFEPTIQPYYLSTHQRTILTAH
jgi:hypothetical protein